MNIKFPLEVDLKGGLVLCETPEEDAASRAHLLSAVQEGERAMLPSFGVGIELFSPAAGDNLQAAALEDQLNIHCTDNGDLLYSVIPGHGSTPRNPVLDVTWTHRATGNNGGLQIGQF